MQRKTKIIAAAAAVGLLTLGGLAGLASAGMDEGMGEGMMGGMHRMWMGGGHGEGHGMMGQHMMERYDANKDGKLTQPEIDQNRQQWLAEFDADKNGTLSLDEFKLLWLKSRSEMMVREFQFFDKDGNGQVTIEEYKTPLSDVVADGDINKDGALSPDDRPMMGERQHRLHHFHGNGGGMDGKGPPQEDGPSNL